MFELRLWGSRYEEGRRNGEDLRGRFIPPPASERKIEFAGRCEELVAGYAPGLLDELRGVADAGEWTNNSSKPSYSSWALSQGALSSLSPVNTRVLFGTVRSLIAPLDRCPVYLCDGPPCKNGTQ